MCPTTLHGLLLFFICVTVVRSETRPVVKTKYGRILGHVLTSDRGNQYYAFQEVPYASPPVGNLRFKGPTPPKEWEDVLHTTENSKICHQIDRGDTPAGLTETEDCLYLNVYTPIEPVGDSVNLPVVVWIHGGGYVNGDGTFQSYSPKYLIDYGIVIVSLNYRLGLLGLLTTEDGVIPGNLALRDQNFALQWVQDNIQLFGGDPTKVTIMGQSAGASSVGYHLLSKQSDGLFRAAILQSSTPIASFAHQKWPNYFAFETGHALNLGFTSNSSMELLQLLQNVPAEYLNHLRFNVSSDRQIGIGSHRNAIWAPVIEDDNLDDAFVTGLMHENIKNGNISKVPILIGFNSEEELLFVSYDVPGEARRFDNHLDLLIQNKYDFTEEDKRIVGAEFRKIYTDGTFEENYGSIVKFLSDESYSTPVTRQAYLQSNYTDVYLYEFSHKGALGNKNIVVKGADSVAHTEELQYLWELPNSPDKNKIAISDILTRNRLLKLWTNFIKYVNPTPQDDIILDLIKWPKVSQDSIKYLNINTTLEIKEDPKKYKEFAEIIDKYVKEPLSNY